MGLHALMREKKHREYKERLEFERAGLRRRNARRRYINLHLKSLLFMALLSVKIGFEADLRVSLFVLLMELPQ